MRLQRRTPLLLPAVGIFSLLAMTTAAADSTTTALPNLSSAVASQSVAATATTASATTATTDSTASASSGTTATSSGITITATGSADSTTGTVPSITGGSTGASLSSGLPKLSSAYTILPASVPPTSNAPFMQTSSLPDGSVFIIVGAIMGFFALSVLLWRALVAWSLHRSVKRANQHQYAPMADAKAAFRAPPAPFYKYTDRPDSMISLSGIGGKGGRRGAGRPTTPSGPAASLFFSPTAGAVSSTPGNRGSNYLPAGYYAAGASAPPNMTSVGGSPYQHQSSMSMSNLDGAARPQSRGSPSWGTLNPHGANGSTLNVNHSPGDQRTPSVYLEDLMDGSGLGTPPPPPPHHRQSQHGRPF